MGNFEGIKHWFVKVLATLSKLLQSRRGLVVTLAGILALNMGIFVWSNANYFPEIQKRDGASGYKLHSARKFAYFHFYTGYFPIASLDDSLAFSKETAMEEMEEHGENLIMEFGHWYRLGEHARIFVLLPSAYMNGTIQYVSVKPFNALIFTGALLVLFFGFWQIQYALQGLVLVLCLNFTPFFLYEIYSHENIFGLLGAGFFLMLGTNIYALFSGTYKKYLFLFTLAISAVVIGFFTEIRNEISVLILCLLLLIAFAKGMSLFKKGVFILIALFTFLGTKQAIRYYFAQEFERAKVLVQEKGGHVYEGKTMSGHLVWHPFYCGLGDFDTKYGYQWSDSVAYEYAVPIMREKYGLELSYTGGYHSDQYYDEAGLYYDKIEENPEYTVVIRDKVLGDIFNDPLWYIEILVKRVCRVLTTTLPLPYLGWLIFPLLYYLWRKRYWTYVKLLVIAFPCSLTPLIIYSGEGSTYNSTYTYLLLVIVLMLTKDKIQPSDES